MILFRQNRYCVQAITIDNHDYPKWCSCIDWRRTWFPYSHRWQGTTAKWDDLYVYPPSCLYKSFNLILIVLHFVLSIFAILWLAHCYKDLFPLAVQFCRLWMHSYLFNHLLCYSFSFHTVFLLPHCRCIQSISNTNTEATCKRNSECMSFACRHNRSIYYTTITTTKRWLLRRGWHIVLAQNVREIQCK